MTQHQDIPGIGNHQAEKAVVLAYFDALEKAGADEVLSVLREHHAPDYHFYGVHPFNELGSSEAVADSFWRPLKQSFTGLQRRQDIFMAGTSEIRMATVGSS